MLEDVHLSAKSEKQKYTKTRWQKCLQRSVPVIDTETKH